jgi:hypothetical protein
MLMLSANRTIAPTTIRKIPVPTVMYCRIPLTGDS